VWRQTCGSQVVNSPIIGCSIAERAEMDDAERVLADAADRIVSFDPT